MSDQPTPEIKMTNRRRMAWLSLAVGITTGVGVLLCAMFIPAVAERVNTVQAVIIALLTFLGSPVVAYMGGAIAANMKLGK